MGISQSVLFFQGILNALGESDRLWHYRRKIKGLTMKLALIYFSFFLAATRALAGDSINICDRGVIGVEIAKAVSANDCSQVSKTAMARLEYLVVVNKELPRLQNGSFRGLSSLKSLFLDSNSIETLEEKAFEGLESLLVLKLDRNKLSKIEGSAFKNLVSLQALDLSYNQLSEVHGVPHLLQLVELNLEANLLNTLPQLSGAESLRSLNLRRNHIRKIQRDKLQSLESLRTVDLEDNRVEELESAAFSQTNIVKINLRNNRLQEIRAGWFSNLSSLRILTLDANAIEEVQDASFQGAESLERLEFHANPLKEISRKRVGLKPEVHIGGVRITP